MTFFDFIWVLFKKFGLGALLVVVILYLLLKPEKTYYISSKLYLMLSRFNRGFKKNAVSSRMKGAILNASKKITKDCQYLDSYDLKIEWVKSTTLEDFSNGKQIIVRMNEKDRWDKNMVYAVHAYAKHGFVPYARPYMSQELDTSINMAITKKILSICSDGSLREFYDNIYSIYKKDPRIDTLFNGLLKADRNGIFTRIYLNEISKLSYIMKEFAPNNEITQEVIKFTEYIISIANRNIGDLTQLIFNESFVHIGVVLPSSYTFGESEAKHGARRVSKLFSKGCRTVYILAIGTKVEIAKAIREVVDGNTDFICASRSDYYKHIFNNGRYKWAICIELQPVNALDENEILELRDKKTVVLRKPTTKKQKKRTTKKK